MRMRKDGPGHGQEWNQNETRNGRKPGDHCSAVQCSAVQCSAVQLERAPGGDRAAGAVTVGLIKIPSSRRPVLGIRHRASTGQGIHRAGQPQGTRSNRSA
jgi:hypothetical protein